MSLRAFLLSTYERADRYKGELKQIARKTVMEKWQDQWDKGKYGRWTWRLIPNIEKWIDRPYGEVGYHLTQMLSGHGCFRKYLYKMRRASSESCLFCGEIDDVEHVFYCPRWNDERDNFKKESGLVFTETNLMRSLEGGELLWETVNKCINNILSKKEEEQRHMA